MLRDISVVLVKYFIDEVLIKLNHYHLFDIYFCKGLDGMKYSNTYL